MEKLNIIEKVPFLLGLASALILALSITYDYGFLVWLGLSYSEVPSTLSDHLRSSLIWLPSAVVGFFFIMTIELFNRRIEQGMTEEEIISSSSTPGFTAWFRDSPKYPIYAFAFFAPITPFLDIDFPLQAWMFAVIILWFIFHRFLFNHPRIIERLNYLLYLATRYVPALGIFVLFSGAIAAEKLPEGKEFIFETSKETIHGVLARSYENHYLIWSKEQDDMMIISASRVNRYYPAPEKSNNSSKKDADLPPL